MKDSVLYNMTRKTEYEANLYAVNTLITDQDVETLSQAPDLNYFSMCSSLNVSPDLMSFKLYSLARRGYSYHMPMEIGSMVPMAMVNGTIYYSTGQASS